jgi:hypothetical protein
LGLQSIDLYAPANNSRMRKSARHHQDYRAIVDSYAD